MHAHDIVIFKDLIFFGNYTDMTTVAFTKTSTLKPVFKFTHFQSQKLHCNVNEQAKHIKMLQFLTDVVV